MERALPAWVVENDASVRDEVAPFVGLSAAELWQITGLGARDALRAVRASPFGARALEMIDPLPASTVALLERLRAIERASR